MAVRQMNWKMLGWTVTTVTAATLMSWPNLALGQPVDSGLQVSQPQLTVPELPGLGEFDRYSPQNHMVKVLLKLDRREVYVFQGQKLLASFPVAIGRPGFATPTGDFKVFEMIVNPAWQDPNTGEVETPGWDGSLGLRWIGFVEMPHGVIGFHGTPNVTSIGQAASHGCVRMRNEDVVKLYDLVKIGTVVRVEP